MRKCGEHAESCMFWWEHAEACMFCIVSKNRQSSACCQAIRRNLIANDGERRHWGIWRIYDWTATSLPGLFSLLSCPQPICPVHHIYTVFNHPQKHIPVRQCFFRRFEAFVHPRGPCSPHGIAKRPFLPPQKGLKNSPNLLMKPSCGGNELAKITNSHTICQTKIICTILAISFPFRWCQNSDQSYRRRARWALLVHFHENWSRSSKHFIYKL